MIEEYRYDVIRDVRAWDSAHPEMKVVGAGCPKIRQGWGVHLASRTFVQPACVFYEILFGEYRECLFRCID